MQPAARLRRHDGEPGKFSWESQGYTPFGHSSRCPHADCTRPCHATCCLASARRALTSASALAYQGHSMHVSLLLPSCDTEGHALTSSVHLAARAEAVRRRLQQHGHHRHAVSCRAQHRDDGVPQARVHQGACGCACASGFLLSICFQLPAEEPAAGLGWIIPAADSAADFAGLAHPVWRALSACLHDSA